MHLLDFILLYIFNQCILVAIYCSSAVAVYTDFFTFLFVKLMESCILCVSFACLYPRYLLFVDEQLKND